MHIMGMSNDDILCKFFLYNFYRLKKNINIFFLFFPPAILRTVSGVLQFGNLQFKQERNSDQAIY